MLRSKATGTTTTTTRTARFPSSISALRTRRATPKKVLRASRASRTYLLARREARRCWAANSVVSPCELERPPLTFERPFAAVRHTISVSVPVSYHNATPVSLSHTARAPISRPPFRRKEAKTLANRSCRTQYKRGNTHTRPIVIALRMRNAFHCNAAAESRRGGWSSQGRIEEL